MASKFNECIKDAELCGRWWWRRWWLVVVGLMCEFACAFMIGRSHMKGKCVSLRLLIGLSAPCPLGLCICLVGVTVMIMDWSPLTSQRQQPHHRHHRYHHHRSLCFRVVVLVPQPSRVRSVGPSQIVKVAIVVKASKDICCDAAKHNFRFRCISSNTIPDYAMRRNIYLFSCTYI